MGESQGGYSIHKSLAGPIRPSLLCPECDLILRDAVQTENGMRICNPCFKKVEEMPNYTSPKTGICVEKDGKPSCYPDKAVRREVLALEMKCEFGCPWTGPLHCFEKHCEACVEFPETCEGCKEELPRKAIKAHQLKECPQITACICGAVFAKGTQDVNLHLQQPGSHFFHIAKLDLSIEELREQHSAEIATLRSEVSVLKKEALKVNQQIHPESPSFVQSLNQLGSTFLPIAAILTLLKEICQLNADVSEMLKPMKGEGLEEFLKYRAKIEQNFRKIVDTLLPLQQYQEMPTAVSMLQEKLAQLEESNAQQDSQIQALISSQFDDQRRKEQLEEEVFLLKTRISELVADGTLLWKIPDISRKRIEAIEKRITSICSPPFYTGRNGYKMCIKAYLNGDGKGYNTHVSLYFIIMEGENDAVLKWPFDYKVSLILVDQNHRRHIVQTFRPTTENNNSQRPLSNITVAFSWPQFAKLSVLDDDAYVKDDVLFLKCVVETTNIFHP